MSDSLCELFADWEPCEGCDKSGYDTGDCVQVCSNGQQYVAKSLVDDNTDEPFAGFVSSPRTWEVRSMCYWLSYIGVDCDGNTISQGAAIATCANLGQLKAELEAAIDEKQDKIVTCAGTPMPAGQPVPTCGEMNTAIAVAGDTKQDKIVTCAGTPMPAGQPVPTCGEMNTAIGDAIDAIPTYTKCGGGDVDGNLVQCDQLSTEDFTIGAAGNIAINKCRTIDLISDECGLLYQTREVDCGGGKFKTVRVTDTARCIANTSYQGDSKVFPTDTTDHSLFISYDELQSLDFAALSAADQARLDAGTITSVTFDVACEGVYTVGIDGVAIEYGGPSGESTVLPILDGQYLNATTTSPIATQSFTAHETSFSEVEFDVFLTAGTHTFEFYLIGFASTVNAAQVALVNNTSRFKICKADA